MKLSSAIKALKLELETDTFYNETDELWQAIHILETVEKHGNYYPPTPKNFVDEADFYDKT
jgi:hypothetical protein